jgi:hypothetical protein
MSNATLTTLSEVFWFAGFVLCCVWVWEAIEAYRDRPRRRFRIGPLGVFCLMMAISLSNTVRLRERREAQAKMEAVSPRKDVK